jgi:hypothetical protein
VFLATKLSESGVLQSLQVNVTVTSTSLNGARSLFLHLHLAVTGISIGCLYGPRSSVCRSMCLHVRLEKSE